MQYIIFKPSRDAGKAHKTGVSDGHIWTGVGTSRWTGINQAGRGANGNGKDKGNGSAVL